MVAIQLKHKSLKNRRELFRQTAQSVDFWCGRKHNMMERPKMSSLHLPLLFMFFLCSNPSLIKNIQTSHTYCTPLNAALQVRLMTVANTQQRHVSSPLISKYISLALIRY